ncbi:hypothetical protein ACFGVR_00645 [Mucilaginibacter sp. AW1-3]
MENNDLERHSTPEKITAIVIIVVLLLFPAKPIYYDTGRLNALKIVYPVIVLGIVIALAIFKDARKALFEKWLRMMVYAPIFIIIMIVLGIIVYFFQVIFAAGPLDGGAGE